MEIKPDKIIPSSRRTISLEITSDARLIVRIPKQARMKDVEQVLQKKRRWIESKLRLYRERYTEAVRAQAERQPLIPSFQQRARTLIPERVEKYAALAGLKYKSISISCARTRWGSCSIDGKLRFSWRLAMAPLAVIDYVVVHELAHLEIKNHSRQFWARVREIFPGYKEHETWLKDHQHLLNV